MKPKFTDMHRFPVPYKQAVDTDVRKTMERRRRQLEAAAQAEAERIAAEKAQAEANRIEAEAKVDERLLRRKVK